MKDAPRNPRNLKPVALGTGITSFELIKNQRKKTKTSRHNRGLATFYNLNQKDRSNSKNHQNMPSQTMNSEELKKVVSE